VWALLVCAALALAPPQLRAQSERSLSLRPSIALVGANDDDCGEAVTQLQRFIGEFPFVRGHRIYVVCDSSAWQSVLHHLTLGYGVIVNSRAAISDIRLRETWFYATALRKGSNGRSGRDIYAHELGHFVCSCIDEAAAERAAVQLLNDAHKHRSQAPVSSR
jgi:hypothetical protein